MYWVSQDINVQELVVGAPLLASSREGGGGKNMIIFHLYKETIANHNELKARGKNKKKVFSV